MAKSFKGSKTEKNLLAAFAGESRRGTGTPISPAPPGRREYERMANIFAETAENEKDARCSSTTSKGRGGYHSRLSRRR